MISVVYQFCKHRNSFQEVYFSLRSLERHLKDDFEVFFVGDLPDGIRAGHIPHSRIPDVFRTNCFDAWRKMEAVLACDAVSDTFIYMSDDVYFLQDTNMADFDRFYFVNRIPLTGNMTRHRALVKDTVLALMEKGIPDPVNAETHLPRVYNKNLMRELMAIYQPKELRLITSTLYYNHFFHDDIRIHLRKDDDVKAGFYGSRNEYSFSSNDPREIGQILSNKRFLNHDDKGLSAALRSFIEDRFSEPCSLEV